MAGCPCGCGCSSEDHNHLLHCPDDTCQAHFQPIADDIDTMSEKHHIDPLLRKVVLILVSPYWRATADFDLPSDYEALIKFQQHFHPYSLFIGCFKQEWSCLQFKFLQLNNLPRDKRQADTQIRHLITYLIEIRHAVWLSRNKALHGDDVTMQLLSYKHTQLLLEIQDLLYDQQAQMMAADRRLFTKPYEYWIGQPTSQLKTFLQRMWATVKAGIAQSNDLGVHFRPVDGYFPPVIPPAIFAVILATPYIPPKPD
jgi:hypothetical protein